MVFALLFPGVQAQDKVRVSGNPLRIDSIRLDAKPITVIYEEWLSAPGRADHLSARRTLAIRGDFSTVVDYQVFTLSGNKVASHSREIGFANGDRIRVDEQLGLLVGIHTPLVFPDDLPVFTAKSNCSENFAGHKERAYENKGDRWLNYSVVSELRGGSNSRITSWRSPELGCVELRRLVEFLDTNGAVASVSDLRAVSVQFGEPDASWFRIPTNYEHVNFSTHFKRMAQASGKVAQQSELAGFERQDAIWAQHRIQDFSLAGKTPRPSVATEGPAQPKK
jgi:hypothetical protein